MIVTIIQTISQRRITSSTDPPSPSCTTPLDPPSSCVAIPCRQVLYAADLSLALQGPFVNLANTLPFEGADQLTTVVFLVQDGRIVGKLTYG